MASDDLPFLPYGRQSILEEEIDAVVEVLRGDWITQGPAIERFEARLCDVTGAAHAVAVSSGTAALHLACLALGAGPGVAAVTTPMTFAATANAVLYAGGKPLFADIDDRTFTLSPEAVVRLAEEHAGPEKIRGILPVHFAGLPADMEAFGSLARERGWFVIEDACHALGAEWRDAEGIWRKVGGGGSDAVVLSFHPVKHITTGEGGAVLTPHAEIAERVRELRHHGIVRDPARLKRHRAAWYHEIQHLGMNYRLTDMQAALGTVQLDRLGTFVDLRRKVAQRYTELLAGDGRITLQAQPSGTRSSWHLFPVKVPHRDRIFTRLREERIGVQVHYFPVHLHPYYQELGYREGLCPAAEALGEQILSLPMFPGLREADIERVADALRRALDEAGRAGTPPDR